MRTTVEISDAQHQALVSLATRRGVRGFSKLVQEAIDRYLADARDGAEAEVLALEGAIDHDESVELRRRIEEAWSGWTTS